MNGESYMKLKNIRNLIFLLIAFSQTAFAAEAVSDCMTNATGNTHDNLRGSYCEFKDGPVTCLVYEAFTGGGGISCTINKGVALRPLPAGNKHFKIKALEGDINRISTGSRICYLYSAYRGGTPSCINP